jgi:peroxiredoxin Q/BCP
MKFSAPSFASWNFVPLVRTAAFVAVLAAALPAQAATPPQVGDDAPRFTLKTLDDQPVDFAQVAQGRSAVLVVLRGWPGYQCPFCTLQVHEYVEHAADFAARNVEVVLVYPGPADQLQAHAKEFSKDRSWPQGVHFVLDPDYTFTVRYGLRWEGKGETAYPSTFIIGPDGKVRFAQVSREHGDRVAAAAVLRLLDGAK